MKALEVIEEGKVERLVGIWNEHSRKGGPGNRAPELGSGGSIPPLAFKDPSFSKHWVSRLWGAGQFKVIGEHRPQFWFWRVPLRLWEQNIPKLQFWIHYNYFSNPASCASIPRGIFISSQRHPKRSKNVNSSTAKQVIHQAIQSSSLHSNALNCIQVCIFSIQKRYLSLHSRSVRSKHYLLCNFYIQKGKRTQRYNSSPLSWVSRITAE